MSEMHRTEPRSSSTTEQMPIHLVPSAPETRRGQADATILVSVAALRQLERHLKLASARSSNRHVAQAERLLAHVLAPLAMVKKDAEAADGTS